MTTIRYAFISAERAVHSPQLNNMRTITLGSRLSFLFGERVASCLGRYEGVSEASFCVAFDCVSMVHAFENLRHLAYRFEQDCVLFVDSNWQCYFVPTTAMSAELEQLQPVGTMRRSDEPFDAPALPDCDCSLVRTPYHPLFEAINGRLLTIGE